MSKSVFDTFVPGFLRLAVLTASRRDLGDDLYDLVQTLWVALRSEFEQAVDLDDDGIISNDEICRLIGKLLILTSEYRAKG